MKYRMRDIENFVATTKCTTIIQAAKLLEIGQPSLTESIQRLEMDCGDTLFYRSRSGIQLTPSGRTFLEGAHKVLQALRDLDRTQESMDIFGAREISLGCHPAVAQYTVPKAFAYLKEHAPDFKIELRHDLSRTIQSEIQRGRIDVGIVINPTEVPDLVIKRLASDEVAVWSAKGHAEHDIVICNLNLFQTQSILKRWKNKPAKTISTDSLELICRLVGEGIGYGIVPERAVKLSGFTLRRMASLPHYKDEICVVHRPEFGKSPPEKMLITALKNSMS